MTHTTTATRDRTVVSSPLGRLTVSGVALATYLLLVGVLTTLALLGTVLIATSASTTVAVLSVWTVGAGSLAAAPSLAGRAVEHLLVAVEPADTSTAG